MNARTTPDWFEYRTMASVEDGLTALGTLYGSHRSAIAIKQGGALRVGDLAIGRVHPKRTGRHGWTRWRLTGQGCSWVSDWGYVEALAELLEAEIVRLDLALTTVSGEVSHDRVLAAYDAGKFCSGGRPPKLITMLSSDPSSGRTCYVGNRGSDKYFRGYEKGLQLAGRLGVEAARALYDGRALSDVYRAEVQLRARKRPIPWAAIQQRDAYFAGTYPFLSELLPGVGPASLGQAARDTRAALTSALRNCKAQYGPTLFTAQQCYGGDMQRVWDSIVGNHHSPQLLRSGALLVDHEQESPKGRG